MDERWTTVTLLLQLATVRKHCEMASMYLAAVPRVVLKETKKRRHILMILFDPGYAIL